MAVMMQQPSQPALPPAWLSRLVAPALVGATALFGSDAALAAVFTADQEIAAQAWQKTDRNFVDRSFAGQDWFSVRQKMVKKKYDSRDEVYAEIRTMLKTLDDKYTRFLTPSMFNAIYAVATGDVAGIGVELAAIDAVGGMTGGTGSEGADVKISSVVEGAPSEKAGLMVGDVLIDADGNSLKGISPEEAASKVRGPVGSKLRLVVQRAGEEEPRVLLITRASVKLEAVTSTTVGNVGYVRIKQFSTTTADDVKKALDAMSGSKSFVLDLRGNTGGYFPGGVDVAKLFLKEKQDITYVVDKRLQVTTYSTFEDGPYVDKPLLLLVDGNTASASEILASALHDLCARARYACLCVRVRMRRARAERFVC